MDWKCNINSIWINYASTWHRQLHWHQFTLALERHASFMSIFTTIGKQQFVLEGLNSSWFISQWHGLTSSNMLVGWLYESTFFIYIAGCSMTLIITELLGVSPLTNVEVQVGAMARQMTVTCYHFVMIIKSLWYLYVFICGLLGGSV